MLPNLAWALVAVFLAATFPAQVEAAAAADAIGGLQVGAAAVAVEADDSMMIAGGIHAGKAAGQEGELRAVAIVLEAGTNKVAIVACDVLMMARAILDPVAAEIEKKTGIPAESILINSTHTHHAPSTVKVHDYAPDAVFTRRVQEAIVQAAVQANAQRTNAAMRFHLGKEHTVGQNSRQLLSDGQIYWIGARTNFVRATGPFDPDLPVLAFDDPQGKPLALLFGHSTHTIGTRAGGRRSPSFYGLAAQELERERGGIVCFLAGASGSTHNLDLSGDECARRIKAAVQTALGHAIVEPVPVLAARKRAVKFRVRDFDDAAEDEAVARYCRRYAPGYAEAVIQVFRNMRRELLPQRGQERETWIQAIRIGEIAWVGIPAEYFTQLGLELKNRSPLPYTFVAELANDWIGYLPNRQAHKLGGYQVWTGFHSYAEPGTGERFIEVALELLYELDILR